MISIVDLIKRECEEYKKAKSVSVLVEKEISDINDMLYSSSSLRFDLNQETSNLPNQPDDKWINLIARKERLERDFKGLCFTISMMDKSLAKLDKDEEHIVRYLWCEDHYCAADDLAREYSMSRASIYRWSDDSLRRLGRIRWGKTFIENS